MAYEAVIGLECHIQLNTRTKMFCDCPAEFGAAPNSNVCPVCLGMPGALPCTNRAAVDSAVRLGLALGCDVLMMPVAPSLPFRIGEKTSDPLAMYLSDIFTIGANLAGIPGLTVPVGLTPAGLPRAVQLLGPEDSEPVLLRAGWALEVKGDTARLDRRHETEFAWPVKR